MSLTFKEMKAQLAADIAERSRQPLSEPPEDWEEIEKHGIGVPHRSLRTREGETPLD